MMNNELAYEGWVRKDLIKFGSGFNLKRMERGHSNGHQQRGCVRHNLVYCSCLARYQVHNKHSINLRGNESKNRKTEQEARGGAVKSGINCFQEEWVSDEAFYKSESKFYDCNSQISHHNEFSIECPPNPHWLMDEPLKQKVPSKICGSSHISEVMNAVSHQELQESKEDGTICVDSV